MKPILHFLHANGFPGGSYQALFESLATHYDVRYTDRIGHQPELPVTNNWPNLFRQITQEFEQNYQQPIVVVGHSLGGILSMRLAAQRPDLVKAAIILDVPALSLLEAQGLRLIKRFKMMDRVTPAHRSIGRREVWANEAEAIAYFRDKPLMQRFDERCLKDYVHFGTQAFEQGIRLHFTPEVELSIYRTIPDNLVLNRPFAVPTALIGGRDSRILKPYQAQRMQRQLDMQLAWLPGTHLFPLEVPELTGQKILHLLEGMLG